jgi:undecaprenyl diphosphate synthase
MLRIFGKKKRSWEPGRLPRHVAIIMDGNGRWAAGQALPRSAGHAAGAETFRRVATYCKEIGIGYLTVYAFSTENRKRPPDEVAAIMDILERYMREAIATMERDKVKMRFFGDTSVLSEGLRALLAEAERLSEGFDGVQVHLCINYGGRDEIIRAAERSAADVADGIADAGAVGVGARHGRLTEDAFSRYMYTAGVPDPDLIIRPGGEVRLSNFLLWQAAYAELYFTDVLWPDFNERELDRAIAAYQERTRRYGGITTKNE